MDCSVIKDLLPLYIDSCCSEESAKLVEGHLKCCDDCKAAFQHMKDLPPAETAAVLPPARASRVSDWKASVMQSVLLFISFAIITVGVALEAATPAGLTNALWALSLVIPATGFLLSLANWYFIRVYKSRRAFSTCSCLATLGITLCAYAWACFHYELPLVDFFEAMPFYTFLFGRGIVLTVVLCVLSKLLSNKYAVMLGKE